MSSNGVQAAIFLINTISTLYIICIMLRFLLQWQKADFYNPICQFLITVTNPLLKPLRRVVPGWFGLDIAALVLMVLIQLAALLALAWVTGYPVNIYILAVAVIKLLQVACNLYFFSILAMAIFSWVNPDPYHPLYQLLVQLNEPLLRPIRRIIPIISGIDLSPLVAIIVLQVIAIYLRSLIGF